MRVWAAGWQARQDWGRSHRRDRHNASEARTGRDKQRLPKTGVRHSIRHARADTETGIQAVRHGQANTETGIQAFRHSRPPAACSPASAAELLHVEAGPAIRVRVAVPLSALPCFVPDTFPIITPT